MQMLKLAAAAAITTMGLGAAAGAHPHPDGEDGKKIHKVIILEGAEADAKLKLKEGERVRILRGDRSAMLAKCEGEKVEVDEATDGEKKKERTRIVLCTKGDADPAERAAHLEKALERIASNESLSAEHRERMTTALREALEEARAGQ